MDWDFALFPELAGKPLVFSQLLDNLRSVHEEVCARNVVLEKELSGNCLPIILEGKQDELACNGMPKILEGKGDDPWFPSNFLTPREGPPPRRPPRSIFTLSTSTPSTCTPRNQETEILARQQELLCRSVGNLTEQQGCLGRRTDVLAKQQATLCQRIGDLADVLAEQQDNFNQSLENLTKEQGDLSGQIAKVLTLAATPKAAAPVRNKVARSRTGSVASMDFHRALSTASSAESRPGMHSCGTVGMESSIPQAHRIPSNQQLRNKSLFQATMQFAVRTSEREKKRAKTKVEDWVIDDDDISEAMLEGRIAEMRWALHQMLNSPMFGAISGMLVFSYAAMIAIETNMMAQDPDVRLSTIQILHQVFTFIFCIELLLRIFADGWSTWVGKEGMWNKMDTLFIVCGAIELIMEAAAGSENAGSSSSIVRGVRIFRVFRTLRLIRSLRMLYEFQKMAYAVLGSFKTLLCSLALLCFVMFFFAVWFTQSAANTEMRIQIEDLHVRYGSLLSTTYTLFMSISGGISWNECYVPLFEMSSGTASGFLVYIAVVYFGVLNIVTSVFVESVARSLQTHKDIIVQDKEDEKKIAMRHVKELFKQVDDDGSGQVSIDEMEQVVYDGSFGRYMEALDLEVEDTRLLFRLLDCDGSGYVNIQEFCDGCLRLKGSAKSIDLASLTFQLKNFFGKWGDFTGYVEESFAEVRRALPQREHDGSKSYDSVDSSQSAFLSTPNLNKGLSTAVMDKGDTQELTEIQTSAVKFS